MEVKVAKLVLVAVHLLFTSGPTSMITVVVGLRSTVDVSTVVDDDRKSSGVSGCKCVPDQWEGVLVSVEREFEAHDGSRPRSADSRISVHYDFVNERFAMLDLNTGRRTVANYKQGSKYVINDNRCIRIQTDDAMTKMCLPDEAERVGDYLIGTDVAVAMWYYTNEFNVSTRTTVMKKNCVPISEEVFIVKRVYSTLMSTQYIDVTLGIRDESVFVAPPTCKRPARVLSIADSASQHLQQVASVSEGNVRKRSSHVVSPSFTQFIYDQLSL